VFNLFLNDLNLRPIDYESADPVLGHFLAQIMYILSQLTYHCGMDYTQKIINSTLDAKNEVATFNANALVIIDAKFEFSQGGTTKANAFMCDFKFKE
jgi:hypothetical protein